MNKIHNIIWSKAQNAWVVVAEGTKAASKAGGAGLRVMIALIMLSPAAGAATLPQGGTVTVGQGTIVNNGSNEMVIKQTTDKLGINWQSFNVGADGHVIFDQPGTHSVALNRVIGSDGSAILGKIDANGQVILINPNGVIFGKDAKVNVGGLVASTLDISDEDFKNGTYRLAAGSKTGEVVNNGTLQAAEGGYIALIGKSVKNNGLIKAQLGTAALAAGDAVTLDFSGDGLINVQVTKSALKALVDNQGVIQADGGSVLMTARATNALTDTVVNNSGVIQAQTINNKSGKIILDGGPLDGTGVVTVGGKLDASAPVSGDGGFIETSGKNLQVKDGVKITTSSMLGKFGNWLLDPDDFNVYSGSGALTSSSIGAATLASALASSNVELKTAASGNSGGDININADVSWSANTKLTLTADNAVNILANISATGDSAGLALSGTEYYLARENKVTLSGANSTFSMNGAAYTVIHDAAGLQAISDMAGKYVLGNDIDLTASSSWNGGLGFTPIGNQTTKFSGAMDGFGHTISNLYINRPTTNYNGLFGYVFAPTISNINISGSVVGKDYSGMLIGYNTADYSHQAGSINNINVLSGSVKGGNYTGGVTGRSDYYTNHTYLTNAANISGIGYVGGISGYMGQSQFLTGFINNGSVTGTSDYVGGIAGYNTAPENYNKNNGNISGGNYTGGLYGYTYSQINNAVNNGNVSGKNNVGGIAGQFSSEWMVSSLSIGKVTGLNSVGGLVGSLSSGELYFSAATGNVDGTTSAGGLVGTSNSGLIHEVYATGNVTGSNSGGLIGNMTGGSLNNSYSAGSAAYGLIGTATSATIGTSYWNTETSGVSTSNGGVGKTSAQLQDKSLLNNGWVWYYAPGTAGPFINLFMGSVDGGSYVTYKGSNFKLTDIFNDDTVNWYTGKSFNQAYAGVDATAGGSQIRNAGNYTLDQIGKTQFDFYIQDYATSLIVSKKDISATVNSASATKTYDGTTSGKINYDLTGTIAGDSVSLNNIDATYSSKNAGSSIYMTVASSTLQGADAGNYFISYFPNYAYGTITKAALAITAAGINKTYDGTTTTGLTLGYTPFSGDTLTVGYTASYSDKNAGTGKTINISGYTLSGASATNYTLVGAPTTATGTISQKALTVTATGSNKVYDGTTTASATLASNKLASDTLVIGSSSKDYSDKNAANGKAITVSGITLSGADAGNYILTGTSATTTGNITKKALLITATGVDKTYDATTAATVNLTDNRIAGDVLTVSKTGAVYANKNAGTGKTITVSGLSITGSDASNYTFNTSSTTTSTINKLTVGSSLTGGTKTYDGTDAATGTLTLNLLAGDVVTSALTGKYDSKNAGASHNITFTNVTYGGADAGNYNLPSAASLTGATGSINQKALTIGMTANNKTYDGTTAATSSGFTDNRISGDSLTISASGINFSNKNAANGKTVTASGITVTGADAGNYTWASSVSSTANIAKAILSITATTGSKVYDGSASASTALVDNRIAGDTLTVTSTGSTFSDKNAANGKTVTTTGINVTGVDAANYSWATSATSLANISKAALVIGATASNKTYDGTSVATVGLTDNRIGSDTLLISKTGAAFADKNAGNGKTVTVSGIAVTGADAGNYSFNTSAVTTANIAKANLVISAIAQDKTYDGSAAATSILSDNRVAGDNLNLSGTSVFANKNAGTGKAVTVSGITVTGTDAGNYNWSTTAASTANIAKAALVVSATASDKTYDGTAAASTVLADNRISGDNLVIGSASTFSDKNAGTGKTVNVTGINLSGADAANYVVNSTSSTTATINKANLVVTAHGNDKTYDGSNSATTSLTDNRISGDNLTLGSTSSTFADKSAGTGKSVTVSGISVTGSDAGNYNWNLSAYTTASIAKAILAVAATASDKTYDGTNNASVTLGDNRVSGDNITLLNTGSTFADKNAGTGKVVTVNGVSLSGADAGNYLVSSTASTTANINKAALVISANASDKIYDGLTSASTTLLDNRVTGDSLLVSASGSNFADKNAGAGKSVTVSGINVTGADAGNYVWNGLANTSATINKANLVISAIASDKAYDGSALADTTLSDNRVLGDNLTVSGTSNFSDKNAGSNKIVSVGGISVTGTDAANYNWGSSVATTATINKAVLNVTAHASDKTYDGTATASTSLTDNRVAGDSLTVGSSGSNFSDKNAATGKTVTVSGINLAGADANNYVVAATTTATANIDKATLTITASAGDKVYDGSIAANTTLSDNRILGDSLVLSSIGSAFADKNAGNGKSVTVSGIVVTGSDAGNYSWSGVANTTANITKAALAISATANNKTYDGGTGATTTLSDNRVAGDDLSLTSTGSAFSDKNAGNGKSVTVNGISVSGDDAQNYTWASSAATTADIAKANLVVSATASDKVYDGSAVATTSLTDNRIAGDSLAVSAGTSSFADKNAGVGKTVNVSGITLSGADAGNYNVNSTATSTADIAKANLVVSAVASDKVYDGSAVAITSLADNRIAGDDFSVSSASSSFSDKNAGVGKAVSVSGIAIAGADSSNYIVNSTAATTANIDKAVLVIGATASGKTYDGNSNAATTFTDNRITGDVLSIGSSSSLFSDKNAGADKVVTVNGLAVTGIDAQNYSWNDSAFTTAGIAKATLVISAVAGNKTYDGTTQASTTLSDNRVVGDNLTLTATGSSFADKNAGAAKTVTVNGISVGGSDAGNYTYNATALSSADISKANLAITAAASDKTYDSTKSANVTLADNRIAGDNLVLSSTGANFADKNAGIGKTVTVDGLSVTGTDAANYNFNSTATTAATINKAVLVVAASASGKNYDGTTSASTILTDNRFEGDNLTLNASSSQFSDKNAGSGKTVTVGGISVAGSDALNYTWNASAATSASIAKANLVIGATGQDKIYDGSTAAGVILTDNRIAGDSLTITKGSAQFSDKNAGTGKSILVNGIAVTGADASNYSWIAQATTTGNIAKANLVISAVAGDKVYDGSTAASVVLNDNRVTGDDLKISTTGAAFADKNAGTNKAVIAGGLAVSGADAGNYSFNSVAASAAEITKAFLNITAKAQNKAYDGSAAATVGFTDNRVMGDDLTIGSASNVFSDKNAGTQKTVTSSGLVVSGSDAANYTFDANQLTSKADISKAALVVTAKPGSKFGGAVDPALGWSLQSGQLYSGDAIGGSLVRAPGEAGGVYAIEKGSLSAGANYDLTVTPGKFEVIRNTSLEQAQDAIAILPAVTKAPASKPVDSLASEKAESSSNIGDYRLLNLGMKLPEEIVSKEDSSLL
jgi:filamentous hemagglutinin family protein